MKSKEITILTNTQGAELVANILEEAGSNGVSIYDTSDLAELIKSDIIWDYVDESLLIKNEIVKVSGYFQEDESVENDISKTLEILKGNSPFNLGSLEMTTSVVDDTDWLNEWKKYYQPIHAGKIVVVPKWINYPQKEDEFIVKLDPGMAFGTGSHESTFMCLSLLNEIQVKDKTVIDVGTGSGILGIASAVMGARSVEAYDIDDIAVDAARENASLNDIANVFSADNANLIDKTKNKFDIALANITADILIDLSKSISEYLNKNGKLIISGVIATRKDSVVDAFKSSGFTVFKEMAMNDWRAYLMEKNGD